LLPALGPRAASGERSIPDGLLRRDEPPVCAKSSREQLQQKLHLLTASHLRRQPDDEATSPNPSGKVEFDPTWAVEINYSQPLGSWPLKYKALVVMHGPKGCGEPCQPLGPGRVRTTEFLTQQVLVFDVGQAVWNLPSRYVIFGGYRWWKNKFGISPDQPNGYFVGTTESTWFAGTAMKF
jgi:hypothetical protein